MNINETFPREKAFSLWGHCQNILDDPRILIIIGFKRYFSHPAKSILNLSLPKL